jgi:hypothetical protein
MIPRPASRLALLYGLLLWTSAAPAHAAEDVAARAAQDPGHALAAVLLAAVACLGVGAALAVLRVLLPGVARATDRGVRQVGSLRLLYAGILPLLGAVLLARGVEAVGARGLEVAYLVVVGIPLGLLLLAGAAAAVPHVGAELLGRDRERSPLARSAAGALALGLSMVVWALPALGGVWTVLLLGYFLAAGLFALRRGDDGALAS